MKDSKELNILAFPTMIKALHQDLEINKKDYLFK